MQPPWKLVVEDLGRIARAEIEARPLLLFVGGNNTGKTYLASLLWGLLSLSGELPIVRGDAYQRCVAWIEERFARREQEPTFNIAPEIHVDLVQIMNDTLRAQGTALVAKTFNRPGFPACMVELQDVPWRKEPSMSWETSKAEDVPHGSLRIHGRRPAWFERTDQARAFRNVIDFLAKTRVVGDLGGLRSAFRAAHSRIHDDPIFLPASRTGFMLLYRSLAQQLVGDALVKTEPRRGPVPDLTAPTIDFINLLVGLKENAGPYPDEAAFLEQAMGGRLALRAEVGLNEVLYEHTDGEPALPMELSSSLVTELAPLVLTLRHVSGYQVLVIEEPEAHLHPKLQRRLAQTIVRLVRKGLFVWITTHSENFCQQINNFIKLGAHPRRVAMQHKHGYEAMDYLDLDDVGAYQFELDPSGKRTVVTEIQKTEAGLIMPTFNRELAALTDEAMDLELPGSDE